MGISKEELVTRLADLERAVPTLSQRVKEAEARLAGQVAAINETRRWVEELERREKEMPVKAETPLLNGVGEPPEEPVV